MERFLRLFNTLILIGILSVLILIWTKMPASTPSLKDFIEAKANKKNVEQLLSEIPFVKIQGTVPVDVQNYALNVDVQNTELDVNVTNSYLEVRQW